MARQVSCYRPREVTHRYGGYERRCGRVVAVEAEAHNARLAAANRDLNAAENLLVVHAAGGATAGSASFAEGLNGHVEERACSGNVTVPMITVDDLAAQHGRPDLVVIDVEGYEGQVLAGAAATLAGGASSFVVEVHETLADFGGSPGQLLERLAGYELYLALSEDEPFRPLEGPFPDRHCFLAALAPHRRESRDFIDDLGPEVRAEFSP